MNDAPSAAAFEQLLKFIKREMPITATLITEVQFTAEAMECHVQNRVIVLRSLRPLRQVIPHRVTSCDIAMDERHTQRTTSQEFEHRKTPKAEGLHA